MPKSLRSKILEQQPCEDCISRAEALKAIRQIHPVDTEYDCTLYDKVDIMYVLNDLPSVAPSYNSVKSELGHVIDEIIIRIEQTRDKDKLCEYPYNRCIDIVREVLGNEV